MEKNVNIFPLQTFLKIPPYTYIMVVMLFLIPVKTYLLNQPVILTGKLFSKSQNDDVV